MIVPGHDRISVDPAVCGGKPCVAGTRMRVMDVLEALAEGASPDEIAEDFPWITVADVQACLHFAAARTGEPMMLAAE